MIFTSPLPDVELPDQTVYDYVFGDIAEEDLGRVAVTDGSTSLTYGDLRGAVDAFAGALAARGVKPGDVVALHAPNVPVWLVAFHGILRAGATATTINSLYTRAEIASQLRDSGATRYVTVSMLLPNALPGCEDAGLPAENVITLDPVEGHESLRDLLGEGHAAPDVPADPDALAVLPYSSGTTGRAKGVMLSHRNLVANASQYLGGAGIGRDDVALAVLPFFHIYGMNVIMNPTLRARGRLVTMPKFELEDFLRLAQEEGITWVYIAPPVAVALAKHPLVADYDLSAAQYILSGAAPLDESLGQAVMARLGCRMLQGYGMTELSPVSHMIAPSLEGLSVGSIGVPLPQVECKLVDPASGEEVPWTEGTRSAAGELWVRGPLVMQGYLGNEEATRETIDDDGFLHTGDIAEVGERGEFYIVDRLKELIKYKGYQVPPAELEAVLLTHPAIADAAVVAHPDEEAGEIPRAFVVLQQGETLTADEVIAYVAERVAPHKKVRLVEFIDAVPKSASGKILRKDLRGR